MSLLASCPHCRHEFPIAARFRGSAVDCVACGERFPFVDGPVLPDDGEEYVVDTAAEEPPAIDVELVSVSPRRSGFQRALRLFAFCIIPSLIAGAGGVYIWHTLHNRESTATGFPVVEPPEGVPPEKVLTLHVTDAGDQFVHEAIVERAAVLFEKEGPRSMSARSSGGRMTVVLAPVGDAQAASKAIDFGVVEEVRGRVIWLRANPLPGLPPGSDKVDRALFVLQNPKKLGFWPRDELETLAKMPADHRKKEVSGALERLLADPDVARMNGDEMLAALAVWGTEDSVPVIEKYVNDPNLNPFQEWGPALKALSRIQGKRALAIVMKAFDQGIGLGGGGQLPVLEGPHGHADIKAAIIAFGPEAEDAVLERIVPKNVAIYGVMCNILKEIGTRKSIPALREIAENDAFAEPLARAARLAIEGRGK